MAPPHTRRLGRRITMMLGGACFVLGAAVMALSPDVVMLVVGRLVLGLGVGLCVQTGPLFLSEIAPFHLRGFFNTLFQLFVTLGILLAQIINFVVQVTDRYSSVGMACMCVAMAKNITSSMFVRACFYYECMCMCVYLRSRTQDSAASPTALQLGSLRPFPPFSPPRTLRKAGPCPWGWLEPLGSCLCWAACLSLRRPTSW